jgi:putative transposase
MARDLQTPMLVSSRTVSKVFKEHELFGSQRHAPAQHGKRFVARYFGQLWHTDLHYYRVEPGEDLQYLIAFIDDRSRAIIHWELLADRTMISTSNALERALATQNDVVQYMMTIENGGEFVGEDFQRTLKEHGIQQWRTEPYTPEQNGKMERWWQTLERTIVDREDIGRFVAQYNRCWPHNGRFEQVGRVRTLWEFWTEMGINYHEPDWWRRAEPGQEYAIP